MIIFFAVLILDLLIGSAVALTQKDDNSSDIQTVTISLTVAVSLSEAGA